MVCTWEILPFGTAVCVGTRDDPVVRGWSSGCAWRNSPFVLCGLTLGSGSGSNFASSALRSMANPIRINTNDAVSRFIERQREGGTKRSSSSLGNDLQSPKLVARRNHSISV